MIIAARRKLIRQLRHHVGAAAEALAVSRAAAGPGHDHIDLSASAFRAHKPPSPVENARLSAMLLGLFGGSGSS
jgi:hypothetical protein